MPSASSQAIIHASADTLMNDIGKDIYVGLLVIGDPHLAGRTPDFRSDDYPRVTLEKFAWALRYAHTHRLLPVMLGDLFDRPRDNPTWLVGELIELLANTACVGIYGNHDCADPQLGDHDSLSLLVKAGCIRLLDDAPWEGTMQGRRVVIGGSSYRKLLPDRFDHDGVQSAMNTPAQQSSPIVFWISHHDLIVPGYIEEGRIHPQEIPGVDVVINGHIHRMLGDVQRGQTLWITPGNISRRSRSDASKAHIPAVLRLDITPTGYTRTSIEVPHQPFEDVFHAAITDMAAHDNQQSACVTGLAQLQARRTEGGAALMEFLDLNLGQFEDNIADEIRKLAQEVTNGGATNSVD